MSELRARVKELETLQRALYIGIASDAGLIRELRARIDELEAPPVVPIGFLITRDRTGRWDWYYDLVGPYNVPASVYRALAWAIEHDQRPPHEVRK